MKDTFRKFQCITERVNFNGALGAVFVITLTLLLVGAPSLKATTPATTSSSFKLVKLPIKNGPTVVWCRVGKTVREIGTKVLVHKKSVYKRFTARDVARLAKTKIGAKIIKACQSQESPRAVPAVQPVIVATPIPAINYCTDGIDNDGDGLIDSSDPDCWLNGSMAEGPSVTPRMSKAYAWTKTDHDPTNFVSPVWITSWQIDDVEMYRAALAAMPVGYRSLMIWDLYGLMTDDPDDYCKGQNGNPDFSCIWWDKGVQRLAAKLDTFFAALKNKGITVDYITLDFEGGMSNWHLSALDTEEKQRAYFASVTADSRWPVVRDALIARGFSVANIPTSVFDFWNSLDYQRWNSLMGERVSKYLNDSIYATARKYFPNIGGSNWGARQCKPEYWVPDFNGHKECLFGAGSTVGSDQNVVLYGGLGNIQYYPLDGVHNYPINPFSAIRFDLNWVRSAKLSGDAKLSAWIPYRQPTALYSTAAIMDEMILLAMTGGVERILLWNPRPWAAGQDPAQLSDDQKDLETSAAMHEFDSLTGAYKLSFKPEALLGWGTNILSSCLSMQNAGTLCRVTTDPLCSADTTIQESATGTEVTACGETKFFPAVKPWTGKSVAPMGHWLVPIKS